MVTRADLRVALIAAAFAVGCGRQTGSVPGVMAGMRAPAVLVSPLPGAVRATWVFHGADLFTCRSSARELRHLHARFGDAVEIAAIAIDADSGYVASFLRVQRVAAPVKYVSRSRDARALTGLQGPALYITRGARVEAVLLGVPLDDPVSIRTRNVDGRIESLLGTRRIGSISSSSPQGAQR